jgi:hypothetical protein
MGLSSPGEFHSEALHEPYVSVSAHTAPIAEKHPRGRSALPSGPIPSLIGPSDSAPNHPLRSTVVTPLHHHYGMFRPSVGHPYARRPGSDPLWLLRLHRHRRFPAFRIVASPWIRSAICGIPLRPSTRLVGTCPTAFQQTAVLIWS